MLYSIGSLVLDMQSGMEIYGDSLTCYSLTEVVHF